MDAREKVIDWISSGMDYSKGIDLLIELTRKPDSGNMYLGRGKYPQWVDKLSYEILKAAKVANVTNWREFIKDAKAGIKVENIEVKKAAGGTKVDQKKGPKLTLPESSDIEKLESLQGNKPLEQYPPVIRRVIHEYASLFQERSKFHKVMGEMPESNAEAVVKKRAEIFDVVKALSDRLEMLYVAKTAFDKDGTIPDEKALFPEPKKEKEGEPDEAELRTQKKNLQSANSKDNTILDYQSNKKGKEKNPMPEGPKRKKIEMRMAERNKKIEEIDTQLLKYAVKE